MSSFLHENRDDVYVLKHWAEMFFSWSLSSILVARKLFLRQLPAKKFGQCVKGRKMYLLLAFLSTVNWFFTVTKQITNLFFLPVDNSNSIR